jgi:hypothetical protein
VHTPRRGRLAALVVVGLVSGAELMAQDAVEGPWGAVFADNAGRSRSAQLPLEFGPAFAVEETWTFDPVPQLLSAGTRLCFDAEGNIYWHSRGYPDAADKIVSLTPYGTLRWASPVRGLGYSTSAQSMVIGHDAVYALGEKRTDYQDVYALDKDTGAQLWRQALDNEPAWNESYQNPTPVLHDGVLFVVGRKDDIAGTAVYQIDAATGTILDHSKVLELDGVLCELAMALKPDAFGAGVHGLYVLSESGRVFAIAVDTTPDARSAWGAWEVAVGEVSALAPSHPIYNPVTDRVYVYTLDSANGSEVVSLDPLTGDDGKTGGNSGIGDHGAWATGALGFDDHTIITGGPEGSLLLYEDDGTGNLSFARQIAGQAWWGHPREYLQLLQADVDGEPHSFAVFGTDSGPELSRGASPQVIVLDLDAASPEEGTLLAYDTGAPEGAYIAGGPSAGPDGKIYYFTISPGGGCLLHALCATPIGATLVAPPDGSTVTAPEAELSVRHANPAQHALTVTFYGRQLDAEESGPFTVVALPDTQYYSESFPWIFNAQTQWVVDNREALNIAYVSHLGDIVNNAAALEQWDNADTALSILETDPALAYGLCVGNHDQLPNGDPNGTETFNTYFPYTRCQGVVPWYGGHFGNNNDSHYILFEAGGIRFIALHFEYDYYNSANAAVLEWADALLRAYADRLAIVSSHAMIGTGMQSGFTPQGAAIYDALKDCPNLVLMLCGHYHGEGQRTDVYEGHTVYTLLSDYQGNETGGNGFLRIMQFVPAEDEVRVSTYSPYLDEYESDADSEFTLDLEMYGVPFTVLGTVTGVPAPDENVSVSWSGLRGGERYEWYVEVSDGNVVTRSPAWSFSAAWALGDLNCDGAVNFDDIDPFLLAMAGPTEYAAAYPDCDRMTGDTNGDGAVDLEDIRPFVALLSGQ